MRLCLTNVKPSIANKKKNLKKMEKTLGDEQAEMFVFGELCLTGYTCRDEFRDLAEPLDGPSVQAVGDMAREHHCSVVFGMPLRERPGLIFNAAVLVNPDGSARAYRKSFLPNFGPFEERFYFTPGHQLPVFSTPLGTVGLCICYDLFFPELVKGLALGGADLVVCISASPTMSQDFFEAILPARAIENTVFMAYANLVGTQESLDFWGGSQVYGPQGRLIKKGDYMKEGSIVADLDFSLLEEARAARPTLRDTRAGLFENLYHLAAGHPRHGGAALVGLHMGSYAHQRMKVDRVTAYGPPDLADGIVFATGCPRDRIASESHHTWGAAFTSAEGKHLTLWLKDEVHQKLERMADTSLLRYVQPESIFSVEES
ncbi:MAG: carbon-nitrogen hydrolase family protein [Candidatus Thermoplasmatota archaeon]|nr:carbon-nitrogen hydrolase family protein [Candidatus Thermoplasmatota archaeon]